MLLLPTKKNLLTYLLFLRGVPMEEKHILFTELQNLTFTRKKGLIEYYQNVKKIIFQNTKFLR